MSTEDLIAAAEAEGFSCSIEDGLLFCEHPSGVTIGCTVGAIGMMKAFYGPTWWTGDMYKALVEAL